MKLLLELLTLVEIDGSPEEIRALYNHRREIKNQLDNLKSRGAFVGQGVVAPPYKTQYDRLQQQLKVVTQDIERSNAAHLISSKHRDASRDILKSRSAITPEIKQSQFAASVKQGQKNWDTLRKQYGGEAGLIGAIKLEVKKLTLDGTEFLNMNKLSKVFDVPERTMYKVFERPDMRHLRRHLPVAGK